ncbi:MAG: hypothetical protein ACT4P4_12020 [Betaproteobacteria bacterium]
MSDVAAAACSSTAWLVLCLAAGHALVRGRLRGRWIALGALGLVALAAALVLPLENWSLRLRSALEAMHLATALAVFCALNVAGTLLLIPAWLFPLVAGAAFGFPPLRATAASPWCARRSSASRGPRWRCCG